MSFQFLRSNNQLVDFQLQNLTRKGGFIMARRNAEKLLEMCKCGSLDACEVLENAHMNYLSADDAEEFASTEYDIDEDDEEDYDDDDDDF